MLDELQEGFLQHTLLLHNRQRRAFDDTACSLLSLLSFFSFRHCSIDAHEYAANDFFAGGRNDRDLGLGRDQPAG